MFYGLEPRPETGVGNDVAACALELRTKIGTLSPLLGIDIFGLANLSMAAVRQGLPGDADFMDFLPLRWDGSLGLGARITDHTGIMALVSYVNDGNTVISAQRFAFTLEVGTFPPVPRRQALALNPHGRPCRRSAFFRKRRRAKGNRRGLDDRGGRRSVRKEGIQEAIELVDGRYVDLQDKAVLAGHPVALHDLGDLARKLGDLRQLPGLGRMRT